MIELQKSALSLSNISIDEVSIKKWLSKKEVEINLEHLPIEFDFDLLTPKQEDDDFFLIKTTIKINKQRKKNSGYIIEMKNLFLFSIDDEVTEQDKQNLQFFSALSIAIAEIRSILFQMTSKAGLGSYTLPSIDLRDLFRKKRTEIKNS
jgi:preprotein translocase subunit SecB